MAHIETVEVHGLLNRSSRVSVEFNRHLNVVFGLNGSGKTSFLNILRSALARDGKFSQWVPFKHAKLQIFSQERQALIEHQLTRTVPPVVRGKVRPTSLDEPTVQLSIKSDSELAHQFWAHEFLSAHRIYEFSLRAPGSSAEFNPYFADLGFEAAIGEMWLRIAAGMQVRISALQTEAMGKIVAALIASSGRANPKISSSGDEIPNVNPQEAFDRLMAFFGTQFRHPFGETEFRDRFVESPNLRSVVAILEGLEVQLLTAKLPQTKLEEFIARLYSRNKHVAFNDNKIEIVLEDQAAIGVRSLSSGEKHLLRLLLGAYRATNCSLLIDEPELSLHVGWQEKLVHMIREMNPDAQVIMATHSPEIVGAVEQLGGKIIDLDKL